MYSIYSYLTVVDCGDFIGFLVVFELSLGAVFDVFVLRFANSS